MATEEEIKNLVEKTVEEYRKQRNYNFTRKHPAITENLALIAGLGFILVILASSFVVLGNDDKMKGLEDFQKTIVKDSSCQQLKIDLRNLNSDGSDPYYNGVGIIKDEITARC